ncbi:MAG: hypothetical protein JWR52_1485 [Marmoricola sp.]|nr:hypothetical protein [Marmoricola sp.]
MTDLVFEEGPIPTSDDAKQQAASAPYMSYKGFKNYLMKFSEPGGLPARLDKSYFGNASGSLVAQVRGTLRYLELIDDDKHPTDLLKGIVAADPADQQQYLKMIFEEKYADALALDQNATSGQLAEVFRARGLSGTTIQKAISYFLAMAEDVGVEVSGHFKNGRVAATNGTPRKRAAKKAIASVPPPLPPAPKVTTEEQQKAKYVDMLMDLASKGDSDVQIELLNRIEKALGIGTSSNPSSRNGTGGSD